jgi:hypothetical protein
MAVAMPSQPPIWMIESFPAELPMPRASFASVTNRTFGRAVLPVKELDT